jgi:hypothetical protein
MLDVLEQEPETIFSTFAMSKRVMPSPSNKKKRSNTPRKNVNQIEKNFINNANDSVVVKYGNDDDLLEPIVNVDDLDVEKLKRIVGFHCATILYFCLQLVFTFTAKQYNIYVVGYAQR